MVDAPNVCVPPATPPDKHLLTARNRTCESTPRSVVNTSTCGWPLPGANGGDQRQGPAAENPALHRLLEMASRKRCRVQAAPQQRRGGHERVECVTGVQRRVRVQELDTMPPNP